MAVIAMTREMGTLGKDVVAGLAQRLGLEVIHHELVEHDIAETSGLPENKVRIDSSKVRLRCLSAGGWIADACDAVLPRRFSSLLPKAMC